MFSIISKLCYVLSIQVAVAEKEHHSAREVADLDEHRGSLIVAVKVNCGIIVVLRQLGDEQIFSRRIHLHLVFVAVDIRQRPAGVTPVLRQFIAQFPDRQVCGEDIVKVVVILPDLSADPRAGE